MYHYGYVSGGNYALAGAVVLAVALTALLVILVLPKERDGRLPRFFQILHDLFQPKTFVIERIVQILYVFFTCLSVLVGLYDFLGALFGLQMGLLFRALFFLLIAPALLRGAYELILLLVIQVKTTREIRQKLDRLLPPASSDPDGPEEGVEEGPEPPDSPPEGPAFSPAPSEDPAPNQARQAVPVTLPSQPPDKRGTMTHCTACGTWYQKDRGSCPICGGAETQDN